ncbi:MAG: alpha/beta hydrolase [Chloroflexi bacterium CFX4]|nr:alpha/beta hydrolase [Chloroflexi bacterium CFX4]MDL1923572.1 alpha/beta hydrolase [Chloroflexi bacterium CFX3]
MLPAVTAAAFLVGAGTAWLARTYQYEMRAAAARQLTGSHFVGVGKTNIEYVLRGEGAPHILISHQAMGGYDQALSVGTLYENSTIIAPSRAGYLRTPLEAGRTPEAMADTFAALLDYLNVPSVIMAGYSAGAMAAIAFALRHPERCRALVLGNAITQTPPAYVMEILAPLALANRWDFSNWLISSAVERTLPLIERDAEILGILRTLQQNNPASLRFEGFKLDIEQMRAFQPKLEAVRVPTLIIHGSMDMLVTAEQARQAAERIPNAQLLMVTRGGHDASVRYPHLVKPALARLIHETSL